MCVLQPRGGLAAASGTRSDGSHRVQEPVERGVHGSHEVGHVRTIPIATDHTGVATYRIGDRNMTCWTLATIKMRRLHDAETVGKRDRNTL